MATKWEDEVRAEQRSREWWAFYAGIFIAIAAMGFGALWFIMATGGLNAGVCQ